MPQQTLQKKHQFRDDLTWNRGNHGFKFGGDFTYVPTLGGLFAFNSAPEYDFNFNADEIALNPGQFPQGSAPRRFCLVQSPVRHCRYAELVPPPISTALASLALLSFRAAIPASTCAKARSSLRSMHRTTGRSRRASHLISAFATTWTSVLSIMPTRQRIEPSRRCRSSAAHSRSKVVEDDKNNISPRIGFAWDFVGDGRSVLRGGYGIYYDQSFLNVPLFAVQQANPEIYATFLTMATI